MVFYVYTDRAHEYRWRLYADNHTDIMADSGEGYKRLTACEHAITVIKRGAGGAGTVYAPGVK